MTHAIGVAAIFGAALAHDHSIFFPYAAFALYLIFGGACVTAIGVSLLAGMTQLVLPSRAVSSTTAGATELAAILAILVVIGSFLFRYFQWREGWAHGWWYDRRQSIWVAAALLYSPLVFANRKIRFPSRAMAAIVLVATLMPFVLYFNYGLILSHLPMAYFTLPMPRIYPTSGFPANASLLAGVPLAVVAIVVRSRLAYFTVGPRSATAELNIQNGWQ